MGENRIMRRATLYAVLAAALLAGACNRDGALAPEDEQFIEAMVALRQAARASGGDAGRYAALKANVLREQGVTEEQLRAYIQTHAHDLERLAAVWESINVRLAEPEARPQ